MQCFRLNSIVVLLCLLLTSCRQPPYAALVKEQGVSSCLQQQKPVFTSVLYRAEVEILKNQLSGLLIIKRMPDSTIRTIFSNEMGLKFFDFEYSDTGFAVKSVLKQLDREVVINQLKADIGYVLMYRIKPDQPDEVWTTGRQKYYAFKNAELRTYYITDEHCSTLQRIEHAAPKKKLVSIDLQPYRKGLPDSVFIAHQTYHFTISLKQIDQ